MIRIRLYKDYLLAISSEEMIMTLYSGRHVVRNNYTHEENLLFNFVFNGIAKALLCLHDRSELRGDGHINMLMPKEISDQDDVWLPMSIPFKETYMDPDTEEVITYYNAMFRNDNFITKNMSTLSTDDENIINQHIDEDTPYVEIDIPEIDAIDLTDIGYVYRAIINLMSNNEAKMLREGVEKCDNRSQIEICIVTAAKRELFAAEGERKERLMYMLGEGCGVPGEVIEAAVKSNNSLPHDLLEKLAGIINEFTSI